jgi:peptidoglycan/xylan/chitin deacetylase (PgdA/CDA1 family)
MNPSEPVLFLTFDDGPVSGPTEFVLEELSRRVIRSTFFCIGDNIRKHPDIFRRIIADGHTVGNHTFNHLNGWKSTSKAYIENVKACDIAAEGAGLPQSTLLFRPPYGRMRRRQIRALGQYKIVMWDVLSVDYNQHLSPEKCLRRTLRACRPGSIVVFHDSYKAEKNMRYALPRLIDHFGDRGYSFRGLGGEVGIRYKV